MTEEALRSTEEHAVALVACERRIIGTYESVLAGAHSQGGAVVSRLSTLMQDHVTSLRTLQGFLVRVLKSTAPPCLLEQPIPNPGPWRIRTEFALLRQAERECLQLYEAALDDEAVSPEFKLEVLIPAQRRGQKCFQRLELGVAVDVRPVAAGSGLARPLSPG